MISTARDLLAAFDALPPAEQKEAAVEILRRSTPTDDLSDVAFDELATELFRMYDTEESAHADS